SAGGTDTVYAGAGVDHIMTLGNATVYAGSGFTEFTDEGTAQRGTKVVGGSGVTEMTSGLGNDTFIGGSGTSFMTDSGAGGHVAFQFDKGIAGIDIVTGFNAATDSIRVTTRSEGWAAFQGHITVVGGSSFVDLAGGTRIEFVGVTNLSSSDFRG
ncbi:MAG TPA: hypothetical protein VKS60_09210, partial [Stellaceae bacterium]|nr:hypothetical protein [Stellaceae bacterium]